MARPIKPEEEVKKRVGLRLYLDQIEVLLCHGKSKQEGVDYLIEWAKENWDLIDNNPLDDVKEAS